MGRELADAFPAASAVFREADDILGFPLSRLCWEGPAEELTNTDNAQPAILVHSIAVWRVISTAASELGFAAGHSLGEFSAYVAAGAMSFADALPVVRKRGELMGNVGRARPGTMSAVIGLDDEAVAEACRSASAGGDGVAVPANFNAPGQVVISGDVAAVAAAGSLAKEAGAKRVLPLNVSGAFHSPLMAGAEAGLRDALAGANLEDPRFPVVSNVTAQPVADAERANDLLVQQLTAPVRWAQSVRTMRDAGVERFVEVGPGNVLTGLLRRIDSSAAGIALGSPAEIEIFLNGGG